MRLRLHSRMMAVEVGLTTLALAFSGSVPFAFNLIAGRKLGPTVLGEVSVVLGLAFFLGQIPGTLSVVAMKFLADARGRGERETAEAIFHFLLVLSVCLAGLLAVGLAAATPLLTLWLHVRAGTVLVAAPLVAAYALYLFFKGVYYGMQSVSSYVVNEILSDVLFFVVLAGVLFFHALPWLLLPFVLNNVIFVVRAVHDLAPFFARFTLGRGAPRRAILRYWALTGTGSLASSGRTMLGTTVAGLFLGHREVGLYAAALTLTNPLFLLPQALSLVLFATMARLHGGGQASSVRDLLQKSTDGLVIALGVVCGLVIINAATILSVLFHAQYAQATTSFQIIVFGAYLSMIVSPSINALSSTTYASIPVFASLTGFTASLAAWLLLIPHFGVAGVALGFVFGAVLTGGIPAYYAVRLLRASPLAFIRAGVLLAGLAGTMVLVRGQPVITSMLFMGLVGLLYLRQGALLLSSGASHGSGRKHLDLLPDTVADEAGSGELDETGIAEAAVESLKSASEFLVARVNQLRALPDPARIVPGMIALVSELDARYTRDMGIMRRNGLEDVLQDVRGLMAEGDRFVLESLENGRGGLSADAVTRDLRTIAPGDRPCILGHYITVLAFMIQRVLHQYLRPLEDAETRAYEISYRLDYLVEGVRDILLARVTAPAP